MFSTRIQAGALKPDSLEHVRGRLLARLDYFLEAVDRNGLGEVRGVSELRSMRRRIAEAADLDALMSLAEPVHRVNHLVCEGLEA